MTETRVIIDLDREATPDQMVALQDGIEASIDHIVGDALVPDRGYAGLVVSFSGTVVTVGAGRLYNGGKVYAYDTATTFDMLPKLAVATKRMVLIVAYGSESDTDVTQVNVLDEARSTPAAPVYSPQALATTHKRLAIVQPAYGNESPNPVAPDVGLALPVAQIVLGPAGILSCVNLIAGKVPNLADHETRIVSLELFEATVGPEVSTLASQLASLANGLKQDDTSQLTGRILTRLAALDAKVGIPDNAADSDADYLLTDANSDITNLLSNCKVQEGIRFADDGANDVVPNLFNPFDTAGVVKGGVLFAAYDRYLRRTTGPATGSVLANSYTYNPVTYGLKTMSRSRIRYGSTFDVCSNSVYWASGQYDPITGIFKLPSGDTFTVTDTSQSYYNLGAQHEQLRLQEFWTDTVSETYWGETVQPPQTIPGYHLAESELIGQDQWLDAIGFTIKALDAQGDVTLLVCQAGDNAAPDTQSVLARVNIPYVNLLVGENVASLTTPVLLEAGQRTSYILITAGAHAIATTDGVNFPQGTFFVLSPSGYAQGDLTKHLALNLYGCKFRQSVTSIQLQNLQLSGGITAIDILATNIVPDSTALTYEIQLAGLWTPLSVETVGLLNAGGSLPPNVPIRVSMAGTPDMMPAIDLAHTNIHVSRPKTSLTHIWPKTPRTPPVSTSQIRVIERFENFDPAFHTAGCKLLTGTGYATQTAPSSFSDVTGTDPQVGSYVERTSVFNLGVAVTSYKVMTSGVTTTALKTFHGAYIKDYVL